MSGHPKELWRSLDTQQLWTGPNPPPRFIQLCTYAKLRGGGFGIRGWKLCEGQEVIAVAKSGRERVVHVRKLLWWDPDGRCMATVKELPTGSGGYKVKEPVAQGHAKFEHIASFLPGVNPLVPCCGCGSEHRVVHVAPDYVGPFDPLAPGARPCYEDCTCECCGAMFWNL